MIRILIGICICLIGVVGQAAAQSVRLQPDRLREGDGISQKVALVANVDPGAQINVAVNYSSDPSAAPSTFIPKFSVLDNSTNDQNPKDGEIRLLLPKPFDRIGVYLVEVGDPPTRLTLKLVHEPNNSSYVSQFVNWLVSAAGGGVRKESRDSALERLEKLTDNKAQDTVAIWTAPMPTVGQGIGKKSPKLRSALMPSWSMNGNYLICTAWRNGKWVLAAYAINRAGVATQLWQWNSPIPGASDFSPAWSPQGDRVVFVRLDRDQKSNIWVLEFDRNRRPKKETKITSIGNVHAILGWDKDLGILFETKSGIEAQASFSQVWAIKPTAPNAQALPLPDGYSSIRGVAPLRRSIFYIEEKIAPRSTIYEVNSTGKRIILTEANCSHQWLTVSHDERWLAFDSDCRP